MNKTVRVRNILAVLCMIIFANPWLFSIGVDSFVRSVEGEIVFEMFDVVDTAYGCTFADGIFIRTGSDAVITSPVAGKIVYAASNVIEEPSAFSSEFFTDLSVQEIPIIVIETAVGRGILVHNVNIERLAIGDAIDAGDTLGVIRYQTGTGQNYFQIAAFEIEMHNHQTSSSEIYSRYWPETFPHAPQSNDPEFDVVIFSPRDLTM